QQRHESGRDAQRGQCVAGQLPSPQLAGRHRCRFGAARLQGHHRVQLTFRRRMIRFALKLTASVMTNRHRPEAISAPVPTVPASPYLRAMFDANVTPPFSVTWMLMLYTEARIRVTAKVSPSARPRPRIDAETTPPFPNGSTAVR